MTTTVHRFTICIDVSYEEHYYKVEELIGYLQNNLDFVVKEYDPYYNFDVCAEVVKNPEEIKP